MAVAKEKRKKYSQKSREIVGIPFVIFVTVN